ncbi:LysE family translocator [Methylobacterium terricola]|uniref:LysE family translocator n=1 Tax=Methylobacterium terricola TaxID=2583531 RepID=A0A5C4LJJ5_9HYPH|nr:LysE family translocator [Methylobacterium terricola]TNC13221.1 LysE family translocator [Methylobacterium terricola]
MPDLTSLALFLAAASLLAITPGPGLFYVAARTLAGGRAEGVASSLGTGLGGLVHVLAGGLGVSALVVTSADMFTVLKLVGAAYLVWIGYRTLRAAHDGSDMVLAAAKPAGPGRAFREGVLVEALNPKTAAFFLAFVPPFVDPSAGSVALSFVMLGAVSVVLNTLADLAIVVAASRLRRSAASRPGLIRRLREASAAAMMVLGFGLALARRPAA